MEVNDEQVDIDAFKTALLFVYNGYKNVVLTSESVQAVLYIGMRWSETLEQLFVGNGRRVGNLGACQKINDLKNLGGMSYLIPSLLINIGLEKSHSLLIVNSYR